MFFITRSSKYDIKFSLFLLLYFHYYIFCCCIIIYFYFQCSFCFLHHFSLPCDRPPTKYIPITPIHHQSCQFANQTPHKKHPFYTIDMSKCLPTNINANQQQIHHRSIADGQSQHSFSNNSHRGYLGTAFPSNLVNSRPELRQSRQSLAAPSERMSRASYAGSIHGGPTSVASSTRRSRPRSRSRDQLNATHIHNHRPGSR